MTEDEMVGWHHGLNGHEFEQALGVGDGQGLHTPPLTATPHPYIYKEVSGGPCGWKGV